MAIGLAFEAQTQLVVHIVCCVLLQEVATNGF